MIDIHTNHVSLTRNTIASNRIVTWGMLCEEFSPVFHCVKGPDNDEADALSRLPFSSNATLEEKKSVQFADSTDSDIKNINPIARNSSDRDTKRPMSPKPKLSHIHPIFSSTIQRTHQISLLPSLNLNAHNNKTPQFKQHPFTQARSFMNTPSRSMRRTTAVQKLSFQKPWWNQPLNGITTPQDTQERTNCCGLSPTSCTLRV